MFVWQLSTIREAFQKYMPDLHQSLEVIKSAWGKDDYPEILMRQFAQLASISIDYGVMEKASPVYVIPGDFGWDDVGSWTSLPRVFSSDENRNTCLGKVIALDSENCICHSSGRLIAAIGVKDLIIVETSDAILVAAQDKSQDIKKILEALKQSGQEEYL